MVIFYSQNKFCQAILMLDGGFLSLMFPWKWFVVGTMQKGNLALVYYQNERIIRYNETEMWRAKCNKHCCHIFNIICKVFDLSSSRKHKPRATLSTFVKYIHLTWRHWEIFIHESHNAVKMVKNEWQDEKVYSINLRLFKCEALTENCQQIQHHLAFFFSLCSLLPKKWRQDREGAEKRFMILIICDAPFFFRLRFSSNVIFSLLLIEKLFSVLCLSRSSSLCTQLCC